MADGKRVRFGGSAKLVPLLMVSSDAGPQIISLSPKQLSCSEPRLVLPNDGEGRKNIAGREQEKDKKY
jgi:hypothetical protein